MKSDHGCSRAVKDHKTHGSFRITVFESQFGSYLDRQKVKKKWLRLNKIKNVLHSALNVNVL